MGGLDLDDGETLMELGDHIRAAAPALVIIDTVGMVTDRNLCRPEEARAFFASVSMAWGFSIFAISGSRTPTSSMIRRAGTASSGPWTKDSAIMSACRPSAQRRSASSFSDSAGTFTATPGRLMPLLLETGPATTTSVVTTVPSVATTRTFTLPSSISRKSPGATSCGSPLKVVPTRSLVPTMS